MPVHDALEAPAPWREGTHRLQAFLGLHILARASALQRHVPGKGLRARAPAVLGGARLRAQDVARAQQRAARVRPYLPRRHHDRLARYDQGWLPAGLGPEPSMELE